MVSTLSGHVLPKITVSIPYYFGWDALLNTIRAVLAQKYPPDCYEIIVLNDGGTESKGKWPTDLSKERVLWVDNVKRLGMVGNWNKAMNQGQCGWVWLLHADDLPYSDFLFRVSQAIIQQPDAGMVHSKYTGWSTNLKDLLYWKGRLQSLIRTRGECISYGAGTAAVRHVLRGVCCPSVVMRRDAFSSTGGFNVSYPYSTDEEFWPRLASKYQVVYISRRLVRYLFHTKQTSATTRGLMDFWEQYRVVNYKAIEHLGAEVTEKDWDGVRDKLCRVAMDLAVKSALEGKKKLGHWYLSKAITESPGCRNSVMFKSAEFALRHPRLGQLGMAAARYASAVQGKMFAQR